MSISLKTGWNYVVYTGKAQPSLDALASIAPYLYEAAWYWNNGTGEWEILRTPGIPPYDRATMVPYGVCALEMSQDCVWTYGADEIAPASVQLYARGASNIVPYLGKAIPPADALASILAYLNPGYGVWYFNNDMNGWDLAGAFMDGTWTSFQSLMVPNGVYAMWPVQNCVWQFAAPVLGGELASAFVWWEGLPDWLEIWGEWDPRWTGQTNTWPANTPISTAWTVKNTGNQTAFFKVKFMGLTSSAVQLSPGETGTLYLYPTTPGAGTYSYTLSILAADQVVKTYPIQVITVAVPTEPEFQSFAVTDYSKA